MVARTRIACHARPAHRGFSYLWVLLSVALTALALAQVGTLWSVEADRERRAELQWVGAQYVNAIGSYYESAPTGVRRYPQSVDELLLDSRSVVVRRHLRRPYPNPITGKSDWEFIRASDGGVRGVRVAEDLRHHFVYSPSKK